MAFEMETSNHRRRANLNLNHVGISVPDCKAAAKWYTEIFGFRKLRPDDLMSRKADPDGIIFKIYGPELEEVKVAYLGTGNGAGFEIFEFVRPKYEGSIATKRFEAKDWTAGGFFHICVTSEDPEKLASDVEESGGRQIGETVLMSNGEIALYVQDPWGNVIEVLSSSFESVLLSKESRAS